MYKSDGITKYKGEHSIDHVHWWNIDPEKRELYLFGRDEYLQSAEDGGALGEPGVDHFMANQFIRNIRILQSMNSDPILIHMKTCGGDFLEGMAIYMAIEACVAPVTILNWGAARSMSSVILQAADRRVMTPYSWFMMHEGDHGFEGTEKQMRSWTRFAEKHHRNVMFDIYAEQMANATRWEGKTRAQIKSWIRRQMDQHEDVYFTAEETVEHGLADSVFGEDCSYDWSRLR